MSHFKIEEILKTEQKTFVLLSIKSQYFFETPGTFLLTIYLIPIFSGSPYQWTLYWFGNDKVQVIIIQSGTTFVVEILSRF